MEIDHIVSPLNLRWVLLFAIDAVFGADIRNNLGKELQKDCIKQQIPK